MNPRSDEISNIIREQIKEYSSKIEMSENDIKKLPFDFSFKRQLFGGE